MRVGGCSSLFELLYSIASTAALFGAQVDCRKVAFAQRSLDLVLLTETIGVAYAGISEDEAGLVQNGQLIAIMKIASLVSAHDNIVDISAVARKIFNDSNLVTILVLTEQETMTVADSGGLDYTICSMAVSLAPGLSEELY